MVLKPHPHSPTLCLLLIESTAPSFQMGQPWRDLRLSLSPHCPLDKVQSISKFVGWIIKVCSESHPSHPCHCHTTTHLKSWFTTPPASASWVPPVRSVLHVQPEQAHEDPSPLPPPLLHVPLTRTCHTSPSPHCGRDRPGLSSCLSTWPHARGGHISAPGPLHWLFPQSGMPFPRYPHGSTRSHSGLCSNTQGKGSCN